MGDFPLIALDANDSGESSLSYSVTITMAISPMLPAYLTATIESSGSTSLVQVGNNYFLYPARWLVGPSATLFRRRDGGSIWPVDADRCGANGKRIPGCLENRGADQYGSGTPTAAATISQRIGVRVWRQLVVTIAGNHFQPGPQRRRRDPSSRDGDRVGRSDQPGPGRGQICGRRRVGPPATLFRRGRDGRSIWPVDADRRGADGKRL